MTVTEETAPEHVKELFDAWYARKARCWLAARLDACWESFPSLGLQKPTLRLRRMRTHWGSMSGTGTLSIRPDLIRAPRECIDYVILHELCHLVHPNHGPEFRELQAQIVPDWERRKHRLELALA